MDIVHMTFLEVLLAAGRSGRMYEPNVIAVRGAEAPNHSNVPSVALVRVMLRHTSSYNESGTLRTGH